MISEVLLMHEGARYVSISVAVLFGVLSTRVDCCLPRSSKSYHDVAPRAQSFFCCGDASFLSATSRLEARFSRWTLRPKQPQDAASARSTS